MASTYKEKLLKEIEDIPEGMMPKLYKIVHLLKIELISGIRKSPTRSSLKGIWKGSQIDESLFHEAKRSLFPYEYK
ncbi:MAG: hypothetical protein Q8Q33_04410 [Chlamydiota bacterium]|nr:hypothetical protein [Chlamydiota bacterium]